MSVILPLPELNILLITKYLDPLDDYKIFRQTNKYYNELIKNNKFYMELKELNYKADVYISHAELQDNGFIRFIFQMCKSFSFSKACYYGYINIVKYLYKKYQLNIHENDEMAFRSSCINGQKNIAEWLYNLSKNDKVKININKDIFRNVCINGHKDVAQWIYNLSKIDNSIIINIKDTDMNILRQSHDDAHKEVTEWLDSILLL